MRILNLDTCRQNKVVYVITYETTKTPEETILIVESREHFFNWLVNCKGLDEEGEYLHFAQYNKHTFANGETYRIYPYQLNSYERYE